MEDRNQPGSYHAGPKHTGPAYRIATALETPDSLNACFRGEARLQFLPAGDLLKADILLLDTRQHTLATWQDNDSITGLLEESGALPVMLVVGQSGSADGYLNDLCGKIGPHRIELLSELELTSNILLMRLSLLLRRSRAQQETDVLYKNAHIVLQSVMQYSNDWMVIKSLDHRFLMVSRVFSEAYGMTSEDIVGKNDLEIGTSIELVLGKPDTDWKGYWELDKQVTDQGTPAILQPLVLENGADGEIRESTDKVPLIDDSGKVFGLLVCVSEFTMDGQQTSNKAQKPNRTWERRKNLTESPALMELNEERRRAEALQKESERTVVAKNRFIAAASHDLRQPLHAVGLYIKVLEARVEGEAQDLVGKIKNCVASLNELLTSLLDISRLDAHVVSAKYRNFPIDAQLNSLVEECGNIARDKSIELSCLTDNSTVYSDPVLLRRVVRNLLLNAINHSNGGNVSMRAQRVGNRVKLMVKDSGIGIPFDKQEFVFDEFTKLENQNDTSSNGLGLGLSIVKHLCVLLDIHLQLRSTPGVGTQVGLLIPLGKSTGEPISPVAASGKKPATADVALPQKLKETANQDHLIVVIDDEVGVCEAVDILLTGCGYDVISATTSDLVIELLTAKNKVPSAMVVDFRLARGVTGIDAINKINQAFDISVPALIVTGDTSESGLQQITQSGLRHLHKPVAAHILLERISSMLVKAESGASVS